MSHRGYTDPDPRNRPLTDTRKQDVRVGDWLVEVLCIGLICLIIAAVLWAST